MHLELITTGIVKKEDAPPKDERGGHTSASAAAYDLACPGRHLAQKGIPEPPSDNDQDFGRRVHKALANSGDVKLLSSFTIKERELFDSCRAIEKKVVLEYFGVDHPAMRVYREERKWVKFRGPDGKIYEHSGQADAVFVAGAKALIIDYKSLAGEVADASSNQQIRDQTALWRGDIMRQGGILVECGGAIVQPYVTHSPVVVNYKEPDMDRSAKEMMERVVRSNDPNSPRIAGELQCKFCRATSNCLEYQKWATATLPSFRNLMELSPEQWLPENRTTFMDRYTIAKQWLEDTKAAMEAGASQDPNFVPGYALMDGQVKTPITDLKTLLDRIVAHGGTAAALLTEAGDVTKKDLEAYFKRLIRNKIKGSIAQNKAYEELLAGLTTPRPNKPTLKKV